MLRYANIAGEKSLPFPKGRATCSCCNGPLIAKCGQIKTHHWAHVSKQDCDTWSEPIGPWHLWWQNLVRPEFVEVPRGCHRADIIGNGGVVVELQHSSIGAEEIAAREAHYGDMVWLFDATNRFDYMRSGGRAFFSLGQTKHLDRCRKPVFLDFGFDVIQVERFSDAVKMVSGFGIARRRGWFFREFLSSVGRQKTLECKAPDSDRSYVSPWDRKSPVRKMRYHTRWVDPMSGQVVTVPKWTEYIKVNYYLRQVGSSRRWDYDELIDRHPEIANGWTSESVEQMKSLLSGTAIILDGLLRVLPSPAGSIRVRRSIAATERLLASADGHIHAGRLPVIKECTKATLLERAKEYEIEVGRIREPEVTARTLRDRQQWLFK